MIHPPSSSELNITHPNMVYTDVYMDYPIGDVVKYWTKIIINNGIRLNKKRLNVSGFDNNNFFRPHYKTFPWAVDILHMYSTKYISMNRVDCYKVCFNLEDSQIIDESYVGTTNYGPHDKIVRYIGTLGYNLSEDEKDFISDLFKGDWVDYLTIQSSRIIVQFWLNDYYPIFRREKILQIRKKILSLRDEC